MADKKRYGVYRLNGDTMDLIASIVADSSNEAEVVARKRWNLKPDHKIAVDAEGAPTELSYTCSDGRFKKCEWCANRPHDAELCSGCEHNRRVIEGIERLTAIKAAQVCEKRAAFQELTGPRCEALKCAAQILHHFGLGATAIATEDQVSQYRRWRLNAYQAGVEVMLQNETCGGSDWWRGWEMVKAAHCRVDSQAEKAAADLTAVCQNALALSEACRSVPKQADTATRSLIEACEAALAWLTNVNTSDPLSLSQKIIAALRKAGYDEGQLDAAAVSMMRGACRYSQPTKQTDGAKYIL